jgi:hypothetical protein
MECTYTYNIKNRYIIYMYIHNVSLFLFNNKEDEQQAIRQIIVKVKKN